MKTAEEIQKLHDLKQQGILSDQEFQDAKEKLLRAENTQQAQFNPTLTPNQWAMAVHLSLFAGFAFPILGLIAPILIWQLKKDDVPGLDDHGKVVVNWIISLILYFCISGVLTIVIVGFVGLLACTVLSIVFPILGAIKANRGELWPYPFSIRFIS